jgi:hypothetical protein
MKKYPVQTSTVARRHDDPFLVLAQEVCSQVELENLAVVFLVLQSAQKCGRTGMRSQLCAPPYYPHRKRKKILIPQQFAATPTVLS